MAVFDFDLVHEYDDKMTVPRERTATTLAAVALLFQLVTIGSAAAPDPGRHPWLAGDTLKPADFATTIRSGGEQPSVVYVGYQALFRSGHIPGATFHGPVSQPAGLADLKTWAATQPKDRPVVVYCGCCPLDDCPNLAPAYTALKELGFTKLRVLLLPTSFAADWVDKGYPVER